MRIPLPGFTIDTNTGSISLTKLMSVIWGAGVRASLACLTAHLLALPISRSTWSCPHLYMPPASGMAQPLRMCSAVPRSWHHTHLSSSERFHSLMFVGHGNTLYVDQMRNFNIRGSMDHSSLHDSDLASMVSHLVHVPYCTRPAALVWWASSWLALISSATSFLFS